MSYKALDQSEKLLKLAANNRIEKIYSILNNIKGSSTYKGDVFEYFLAGLYEGTGWKTQIKGGKNDKGVDILLYHPRHRSKIHAIIQAKNVKKPLPKKEILNEYSHFFGTDFSSSQGTAHQYNCCQLIIISLNGYTGGAKNCSNPKKATHKVYHYDWSDVSKLIQRYAGKHKKTYQVTIEYQKFFIFIPTVALILLVVSFFLNHFNKETLFPIKKLSDEMIVRLNKTALGSLAQKDCKRLHYSLEKCRKKRVYQYAKTYGSLKKGLMAHFCGSSHFNSGRCGQYGEKKALYVLTGK